MAFPESHRVRYQRNPLEVVICQLRFPPVLRIDTEVPAVFQERIRREYPLFRERARQVMPPVPPEIAKAMGNDLPMVLSAMGAVGNRLYDFASDDNVWAVTLSRDFVALASRRYTTWEDFRARLVRLTDSLRDEYAPAFFVRVGLRYRDVIRKSDWGLQDVPWAELLQSHIAGELSSPIIASHINSVVSDVTIRVDGGMVRIKHGLAPAGDRSDPTIYFIDSDFSTTERTEVGDALGRLDYFNREAGRLFRWSIKDRLHDAMGPDHI